MQNPGAWEQVAPTSTTADRPGGAGPGSSEVAGSAKSYSHRGGGVFTGQSLVEPRGVEDRRVESVGLKLTPCGGGGKKQDGATAGGGRGTATGREAM